MEDTGYGNAMTEIALALAMAFFSIMVLAMISMGVPAESQSAATTGAVLAKAETDAAPAAKVEQTSDDRLVIFHDGRFWDRDLNALDPRAISNGGRIILALDPSLPMKDALGARARIDASNLVVTALDDQWLQALRSKIHDRP